MKRFSRLALAMLVITVFNISSKKVYAEDGHSSCNIKKNSIVLTNGKLNVQDPKNTKEEIQQKIKELDEFIKALDKPEPKKVISNYKDIIGVCYVRLSRYYYLLKDYEKGIVSLDKSIEYFKNSNSDTARKEIDKSKKILNNTLKDLNNLKEESKKPDSKLNKRRINNLIKLSNEALGRLNENKKQKPVNKPKRNSY